MIMVRKAHLNVDLLEVLPERVFLWRSFLFFFYFLTLEDFHAFKF